MREKKNSSPRDIDAPKPVKSFLPRAVPAAELESLDSSNRLSVCVGARGRVFIQGIDAILGWQDAVNMAAWIVALVDPKETRLRELLVEIRK